MRPSPGFVGNPSVAELLVLTRSSCLPFTEAVTVVVPRWPGVNFTVAAAVPPSTRFPTLQVTVCLETVQLPRVEVTVMAVADAGRAAEAVTPVAAPGPVLVTVTVTVVDTPT